jgi:hypothetical protein
MPIAAGVVKRRGLITVGTLKLAATKYVRAAQRQLCQHTLDLGAGRIINGARRTDTQDLRDG